MNHQSKAFARLQISQLLTTVLIAVIIFLLTGCEKTSPPGEMDSPAAASQPDEFDFTIRRENPSVQYGASMDQMAELTTADFAPFPGEFSVTTDAAGEALLRGSAGRSSCSVYVFQQSSLLTKRSCPRIAAESGNTACLEEGASIYNRCAGQLIMTPGALVNGACGSLGTASASYCPAIVELGEDDWALVMYEPKSQLTLIASFEGEASVTFTDARPTKIPSGHFASIHDADSLPVPGFEPGVPYPFSHLPNFVDHVDHLNNQAPLWLCRTRSHASLDAVPFPDALVGDAVITAGGLNLRSGPGTEHGIVGSYTGGTELGVSAKSADNGWLQVTTPDGKDGWMAKWLTDLCIDESELEIAEVEPIEIVAPPQPVTTGIQPMAIAMDRCYNYDERPELRWQYDGALADDVYFKVDIAFRPEDAPDATWHDVHWVKETSFTLPGYLNSIMFNATRELVWTVTLMRQTGVDEKGMPIGILLSEPARGQKTCWLGRPMESRPTDEPECDNYPYCGNGYP